MIINICHDQQELAVRITQPGCSGGQVIDHDLFLLRIQAPHCPHLLKSPICLTGCWPQHREPFFDPNCPPHELPALVYPALKTDEEGRIVFRFDSLLHKLPKGRYIGTIIFDGTPITELDLDLCSIPFLVDEAVVVTSQTDEDC